MKTKTCTLSYKTLKILSTFCSLVWKIKENLKILFSKIWPDGTDSCNIMCIWSASEWQARENSKISICQKSMNILPHPAYWSPSNSAVKVAILGTDFLVFKLQLLLWQVGLGLISGQREVCANFDELQFWSPLRYRDVLYSFEKFQSFSKWSQLVKAIAAIWIPENPCLI